MRVPVLIPVIASILILVSVFFIALSVNLSPAWATFPGANGKIAFVSDRDGASEIYTMNPDGTDVTRLTTTGFNAIPSWSPDGTKIAFESFRIVNNNVFNEFYVMNADGTDVTLINQSFIVGYVWSPDGTKIAFTLFNDGTHEIYTMNSDGTDVTQLTNSGFNIVPSWSPDGTKIAFANVRDGNGDIYVMNSDGTGVTRLTNSPNIDTDPIWSPDGSKIAFRSDRDGSLEVYIMNHDGSDVTRLTNVGPVFEPRWSPDGTKLAFISFKDNNKGLYVMNADGTGLTLLTSDAQFFPPAWSPDSTKIAFWSTKVVDNNLSHEIFVINADGTGETNLTNNPALDQHPDWQAITTPVDTTPPVITLLGDVTVTLLVGQTYNDAGATAADDVDGDLTGAIITVNPVDTSIAGTYIVTYDVSDSSGNAAVQVTRTVEVQSPAQATEDLIEDITSGELPENIQTSLTATLNQAVALLTDGNPNNDSAACGKLDAFINQVNAQEGKKLTTDEANSLRNFAESISASIGCS